MTWIDTRTLPLKEGKYTCLVATDDWGNLSEAKLQYFNGKDWDWYDSAVQYIKFWQASKEDYEIICEFHEAEYEKYLNQQVEEAKNFGGL